MTEQALTDDMSLDQAVPRQSNFLAKEDCPLTVTIAGMASTEIEGDHGIERRTILKFQEDVKPLVLNQTNKELLKHATGATTVGGLKGKRIEVYNDPSIMFGGKMVGGIRVRAAQQPAQLAPGGENVDDIPF